MNYQSVSELRGKCVVCREKLPELPSETLPDQVLYECPRCGTYVITQIAISNLWGWSEDGRKKISAYVRERNIVRANSSHEVPAPALIATNTGVPIYLQGALTLQQAEDRFPRTVPERLDRSLVNLARMSITPGKHLRIDVNESGPVLYSEDNDASNFILSQLEEAALIHVDPTYREKPFPHIRSVTVIARGWERVAQIERG